MARTRKYSSQLSFALTDDDSRMLDELSVYYGTDRSKFIRMLIRATYDRHVKRLNINKGETLENGAS